jgi:hypothetical protein
LKQKLVGGLELMFFPFSWEFHHHWRTRHIFQRGRYTTNQRGCLNLMVPTGQKSGCTW